jgi:hypothetical protein
VRCGEWTETRIIGPIAPAYWRTCIAMRLGPFETVGLGAQ